MSRDAKIYQPGPSQTIPPIVKRHYPHLDDEQRRKQLDQVLTDNKWIDSPLGPPLSAGLLYLAGTQVRPGPTAIGSISSTKSGIGLQGASARCWRR